MSHISISLVGHDLITAMLKNLHEHLIKKKTEENLLTLQ